MYYQKHVFMCTNIKQAGKACCGVHDSEGALRYLKEQLLVCEQFGSGRIRVSPSGCLGRCAQGPCVVVYPEGVWYRYESEHDLDRILKEHLLEGNPVVDLQLEPLDG